MAAHSAAAGNLHVPPDQPVSGWGAWLRAIANSVNLLAPLDSPVFTGDARAVTPPAGDADTSVATTEFVTDAIAAALPGITHSVRVRTVSATLNSAVANGGILRFDTIDHDSDGFVTVAAPFDRITVPAELGGLYMLVGWSSGNGTQATTLGMGVLINGSQVVSETNQTITGPASVNYTLDNGAVEIGYLAAGDILQLRNNSVSAGTNAFTSVILTLARLEPSGPPGAPGTGASPSVTLPLMDGAVAASGASLDYSRGDHIHPTDAFLQGQIDSIAGSSGLGTITGVAAGTGLTGGGTSGGVTLSLIAPVAVALGGTGAATAPAALTSLGAEAAIAPGTTAQYWRGDKNWTTLDKTAVGLGNVDNTSDLAKPISTATQTQLNLKAPLASPALTGNPTAPTPSVGDNDTSIATTAFVAAGFAPLNSPISIVTPVSGATVTMAAGTRALYVNTAALAALTIRLPPTPAVGQAAELCFAAPVTALAIQSSAAVPVPGSPTSAFGPGAAIILRYVAGSWVYWK